MLLVSFAFCVISSQTSLRVIDFDNKVIYVTKTLLYQRLESDTKKEFHIDPPKTKASLRDVPINKQCEIALKKQFIQRNNIMAKKSAKPLPGFENLLFTTKFGTPICDQMTLDLYTHVMEEQKQSDMTKLENTLDDVFTGGDEYAEANFKKACAEEKKVIKFECVG